MIRVLFLYKYGILGGVCTQLHHRLLKLKDGLIEVHCGFMSNQGAEELLEGMCYLHFSLNVEKMQRLVNEVKFDVIVVIDTEEYIEKISQMENLPPVVIEVHTSIERNLEYLTRVPDSIEPKFITVSQYMKREIEKRTEVSEGDLTVIGNIIDGERFYYSPVKLENKDTVPPIIWIGKIDDHKNWKLAMEISSLLNVDEIKHELWIIGGHTANQSTSEEFFSTAEELGLIGNLKWFDKIKHDEMPKFLRSAIRRGGVGLVTSKGESFGMSILESLLTGLPVICSNNSAIPELCQNREYMPLFDLGDKDKAKNEIVGLIGEWVKNDEFIGMIERETKQLAKRYSSEDIGERYWRKIIQISERD